MTLFKAPGFPLLPDHELLQLSRFTNVMTGLCLRFTSLIALIKLLVLNSRSFQSSCDFFFDEAHISDTCKDLQYFEFLQGAGETTYRRCIRLMRLLRQYLQAHQLVEKVNDEPVSTNSPAEKGGLSISHLKTALLFLSEKRDALPFIGARAGHTKVNTKRKK